MTEGGGAGPSTTIAVPDACFFGFSVRLTEGGEKGVMGRSAGLGLANGNGLARFEYTLGDMAEAMQDDPVVTILLLNVKMSAVEATADAPLADNISPGAAFE